MVQFNLAKALTGAALFQAALALPFGGGLLEASRLRTRDSGDCLKPKVFIISLVSFSDKVNLIAL